MKFLLTIGLSVLLFCGLSYLSIYQFAAAQNQSIQLADLDEDSSGETGTEELELKENIEAITHPPTNSHLYFKTKLNHMFSHKHTWFKHFVDEISTPPPEA